MNTSWGIHILYILFVPDYQVPVSDSLFKNITTDEVDDAGNFINTVNLVFNYEFTGRGSKVGKIAYQGFSISLDVMRTCGIRILKGVSNFIIEKTD